MSEAETKKWAIAKLQAETAALREELAKCREEGRRQWLSAHDHQCTFSINPEKCPRGVNCEWPMPKILEEEK